MRATAAVPFAILLFSALAACTLAVETGTASVSGLGDRKDCPVRPWTDSQSQKRERFIPVVFDQPFDKTPQVAVTIVSKDVRMDYKIRTSIRLKTEARDVTPEGFTLYIGTWCYTYVYSATVNWIAAADEGAETVASGSLQVT